MSKIVSTILIAILGIIVGFLIYFFFPNNSVKIYFSNSLEDPEVLDCAQVYPVERKINEKSPYYALFELLQGPTEQEIEDGYFTNINPGVKIQDLVINNRICTVDLSEELIYQVGGSCLVSAIRAQIEKTLLDFNEIDEVIISVNGEVEEILQP